MLFNSLIFVAFALAFFGLWPLARRHDNGRYAYIIVCSFLFYGWWDWRYVPLLVATGIIDFWAGLGIDRYPHHRRQILLVSILSNLLTLGFFKYSGFMIANANTMLAWAGSTSRLPLLSVILPVGISFYTFQSISYTVDIYRGTLKPTRNVLHFFSALAMFPHLVAGPIMRSAYLLPQLRSGRAATEEERWSGLRLIVHGYFKKVVIADNLAATVNAAFDGRMPVAGALYWWLVVSMFAVQIYCDFSGYSDIARGLAKWMGYDFSLNFRHPYTSTSVREFWTRWHMSLSSWFRDYVYIPLGGSRNGEWAGHRNMWIAMVLSGLWHGAAWHFLAWGGLHAVYLSIERVTQWPARLASRPAGRLLAWCLLLAQIWVAWVFFRARSMRQAVQIVQAMFSTDNGGVPIAWPALFFLALGVGREIYCYLDLDWRSVAPTRAVEYVEALSLAVLIAMCVYLRGPGGAFIYFQF